MTKITRRDFLKGLGITTTAAALGNFNAVAEVLIGEVDERDRPYDQWRIEGAEWVMMIDLARCDGCTDLDVPRCTTACIEGHHTPNEHEYIKVFEMSDDITDHADFFPRPCQQCENPPCVHVCPVSAAWQRDGDKLTLIDHDRCIGCRLCMAACPYEVRFFLFGDNPNEDNIKDKDYEDQMPFSLIRDRGVTAKCEFCGLQFIGQLPHCVSQCHQGALYFGDKHENIVTNSAGESVILDQTLFERAGFRWKEEEGTHPRVFYLPATKEDH